MIIGASIYMYVIVVPNTTFTKTKEAIVKSAEAKREMIVNIVYCLLLVANLTLRIIIKNKRTNKRVVVTF